MSKDKKPFKETKFGGFLNKAAGAIPDILTVAGKVATGDISGAFNEVGDLLGSKKEDSEEINALYKEFMLSKMEWEKEMYELEIKDRESARLREVEIAKTGKTDWMMITTGLTGLGSFVLMVIAVIFIPEVKDNKLFIHLMGMIEGVVISNLFSYYFGTSKSSKDKDEKLSLQ